MPNRTPNIQQGISNGQIGSGKGRGKVTADAFVANLGDRTSSSVLVLLVVMIVVIIGRFRPTFGIQHFQEGAGSE